MSWFRSKKSYYDKPMWETEEEWRDQIVCQLVYIRCAVYFLAFVVAIVASASWLRVIGVSDDTIFVAYFVILIAAIGQYWRAYSKGKYMETRYLNTDYSGDRDN